MIAVALLLPALATVVAAGQAAPRISPRDVLKIAVLQTDYFTRAYTVDADGSIDFPMLGRVQVTGKTARELQTYLASLLKERDFMVNPTVTVDLDQIANKKFIVAGEGVNQPGTFAFAGELRIMEALLRAGSTKPEAAGEAMVIRMRRDDAGNGDSSEPVQVLRVDLRALQGADVTAHNIVIEDGDQVFVPKAQQVFIDGYVRSPGAYSIEPGMTVAKALAIAGGVTELGAANRITIKRSAADGTVETIKVEENKLATDLVKPGDLIYVPKRRV